MVGDGRTNANAARMKCTALCVVQHEGANANQQV
jgi:hypothetical protein